MNSDNAYRNESLSLNYGELKYDNDYTLNEYEKILNQYSDKKEAPNLN